MDDGFRQWMQDKLALFESGLINLLTTIDCPVDNLRKAMSYAVLGTSKRLRPLIIYATGDMFAASLTELNLAAQAVELIHSYSLVHDDLPAMDNAMLRRGKMSCFRAFGESMAILVGDALQTLAFKILSSAAVLVPEKRLKMISVLSNASGCCGMISGQALDVLNLPDNSYTEATLYQMYRLKTGALIRASVELGMLAGSAQPTSEMQHALQSYSDYLALAFQIQDDILDITGQQELTGKSIGIDQMQQKITYPGLVGIEAANDKVAELIVYAVKELHIFAERADKLRQLTTFLSQRSN